MPVPPKRRPNSSKKRRASHFALRAKNLIKCKNCGKPSLAHQTCPSCGTYQGRQVLKIKVKNDKTKSKEKK
ncbi:50S ribosomal protein L32 [Candidatus Parcubacteria bacterium]|nr:MAG: 50S ribosomal protein L32 [Candidatus Parcubacteria bacterium]